LGRTELAIRRLHPSVSLASIGQIIAFFSPLKYANDLIEDAYTGITHFNPFIDVAMLFLLS
jgi:hypothetical protein